MRRLTAGAGHFDVCNLRLARAPAALRGLEEVDTGFRVPGSGIGGFTLCRFRALGRQLRVFLARDIHEIRVDNALRVTLLFGDAGVEPQRFVTEARDEVERVRDQL